MNEDTSICHMVTTGAKIFGPVDVVYSRDIQGLCTRPYHNHKNGCPNFGKRKGKFSDFPACPPHAPYFPDEYETKVLVAVYEILFCEYMALMKLKHPDWTDCQLRNPLYWQGYFRTRFKSWVKANVPDDGYCAIFVPEALGVNVTETCSKLGIQLEWPPVDSVFMIALYAKELM